MFCLALIWHPAKLCLRCYSVSSYRETCNSAFVWSLEGVWAHAELIASAEHHFRLKYLCLYDDTWVSERCQISNQMSFALGVASNLSAVLLILAGSFPEAHKCRRLWKISRWRNSSFIQTSSIRITIVLACFGPSFGKHPHQKARFSAVENQ